MKFRRKTIAVALAHLRGAGAGAACLALVSAPLASSWAATAELIDKVTVTGTHIPTIDGQSGLPVQVITRDEIERANIQTAAQLVNTISATMSFSALNESQGLGNNTQPGFAGGALRGLGYQNTLILLNGRRIANYAFVNVGGDLNSIPVSAIERVEVLKDGASAIYGSDAVAGVINFILRSTYQGAEIYAQYTSPEHTGGYATHFNAAAGYGDLATQKFNAYVMVDYQKFGGIRARDRSFAANSYIPSQGLDRTSTASFPANVDIPATDNTPARIRNPTGDPANGYGNPSCAPPLSFPTAASPNQCRFNGLGEYTISDPSERLNVVGALTWQIDPDNQFFLNATYVRNKFTFELSPTQVSNQTTFQNVRRFLLPPTSEFYPHAFAQSFGIDGRPLNLYWRALELGPRINEPSSQQWNVVAGMKGLLKGWTYDGAFNYNQSLVENRYSGWARESLLLPILNSGTVNPFGPNTQDINDRLRSTLVDQTLRTANGSVVSLDFHAANDVYALPAGPLAVATGFDARKERVTQSSDPTLESGDILNAMTFSSFTGSRNVWAVFAEGSAPLFQGFEANLAVRYDHYSDFGGTTNPKVSLRWQPAPTVLLRASAGTGFLAPSLPGLFQPPTYGFTAGGLSDPARCLVTRSPQDCNRSFPAQFGGNPALRPINSTQWSVGGVWAPVRGLSIGIDYVAILLHDRIASFSPVDLFPQCPDGVTGVTCYLIHRGPVQPAFPTLPGPIVLIDQFLINMGKSKVNAIDVSGSYKSPAHDWGQLSLTFNGTYNIQYLVQQFDGSSYTNLINHYASGTLPYWHHYLMLGWNRGPWSATVTQNYQTGVYDQFPEPTTGTRLRKIGDYDIWNIAGMYTGLRHWTFSAGVKNLMDRNPPFSNQNQAGQIGYDPATTDPHGRLFWVGLKYVFN